METTYQNFWEDPKNLLCPSELGGNCEYYECDHKNLTRNGESCDLYTVWETFQKAYLEARSDFHKHYVKTKYGVISRQDADVLFGKTVPPKKVRFPPPCRYGNDCWDHHCTDGHNIDFCGNDPDCKNILCPYRHSLP